MLFFGQKITQKEYLVKFHAALAPYTARDSQYSIPPGLAGMAREAVAGYLSGGRLPLQQVCPKLILHKMGSGGSDRKKEWIKGHLDVYMRALNEAVEPLVGEGYMVVWTDGAKEIRMGIHVAGSGVFFGLGDSRNLSEPLPYGEQTNNRAELWAFIQALRKTPPQDKLLVVSDSSYVVRGIALWSAAWRVKGWRVKGKLIPNADLWSLAVSLVQPRRHIAVMHVFSHVGVPGNEGADALASASLNQHPLLSLKPEQPAQPLTPTQPMYNMPRMVHMNFAPDVPQLTLERVKGPGNTQTKQSQPLPLQSEAPPVLQPQPLPLQSEAPPIRLSASALEELQQKLHHMPPQQHPPPMGREGELVEPQGVGLEEGSTETSLEGPRHEGSGRSTRLAGSGRGEVSDRDRGRSSTEKGNNKGKGRAASVWGAIGLEQMSSGESGPVGSSIDSGDISEGPILPQDGGSAGESSTDSDGYSETDVSRTVYSTDVSEGVVRHRRARYGRQKRLKPY